MIVRVGYISYLNMVPFHQNFGPQTRDLNGRVVEFKTMSPRALGMEAEKGLIDAGALSLVDGLRLGEAFEPLGTFGIGAKTIAQSVLLFSRGPISQLSGEIAVTDETSTSFRLLQVLLDIRYGLKRLHFGRIASSMLYDGSANGLLLIGDEALRAKVDGIKGLPVVTDLGEEWLRWKGVPFVFARWMVRAAVRQEVKDLLEGALEKSLASTDNNRQIIATAEAETRPIGREEIERYWQGFAYKLTPAHEQSVRIFSELLEKACLTA
jgi:chorismate dehydratase